MSDYYSSRPCDVCGTLLPENQGYDVHRLHVDPIYRRARELGWEDAFMVDPADDEPDQREWSVVECEGREVCKTDSRKAAETIRDALNEYWAYHATHDLNWREKE